MRDLLEQIAYQAQRTTGEAVRHTVRQDQPGGPDRTPRWMRGAARRDRRARRGYR